MLNLRPSNRFVVAIAIGSSVLSGAAYGGPWLGPGDLALRHDVQLLADAGVIDGPVTSWPMSWGEVSRSFADVDSADLSAAELEAFRRVRDRARAAMRIDTVEIDARLAVAEDPRRLRTFEATPRESAEIESGAEWTGERFAWNLQVQKVAGPDDGKNVRLDGSYAGVVLGNFMFSAGAMDRWWGPGWEGSLILSNNPRPIPAFSVERNFSDPFETKWLRWIGPWTASLVWGQLEHDRDVPNARFFGLRVAFKPLRDLEIALSRSAQWCGAGRPCNAGTFTDLLLGRDNRGNDVTFENEPGNQLAGLDLRWASPFSELPYAIYGQLIGEDEAGGFPSEFLGLYGLEAWGSSQRWGSYRVHLEFADTACGSTGSDPKFDCAYNHGIYQDGYRYRERSIGHSIDNDARILSLGATLVEPDGDSWNVLVRGGKLNRAGAPDPANSVARTEQKLANIEISHTQRYFFGTVDFGIGGDRLEDAISGDTSNDLRAFVQLHYGY
ncbi:MAG: capsule assembly Wzi family protein [Gammaproteobacteria bacterium]